MSILTPLGDRTWFGRKDQIDLEVLFVYFFLTSTYIDVAKWMLLSSPIDVFAFKVCSFVAQGYKITNLTSKKGCNIYSGTEHCAPADCFCTGRNLFAECV